jgi:hypothetical protein
MFLFNNNLKNGAVVQVVTDYSLERIGKIIRVGPDDEFVILLPHDNAEIQTLIAAGTKEPVQLDYKPSVLWPTMVFTKTIKEIIILKNGEDKTNISDIISPKSEETVSTSDDSYKKHAV